MKFNLGTLKCILHLQKYFCTYLLYMTKYVLRKKCYGKRNFCIPFICLHNFPDSSYDRMRTQNELFNKADVNEVT